MAPHTFTAQARAPRAVGWPSPPVLEWLRSRLTASGGDPSVVPDEPFRFMRLTEIEARTGLKRSAIYKYIAAGKFPAPVSLTGTPRAYNDAPRAA